MFGAALSSLIAQACFFIVIYRIAQKHYPIPYEIRKIVTILILGTLLLMFSYVPEEWNTIVRISIKSAVFISFPFLLYIFRFYEEIELIRLKEMIHKWKNPGKWHENIVNFLKNKAI
jgi:O-antigen/teichoic acid export membrane protein